MEDTALDPQKVEMVRELVRRRGSMSPEKQSMVDELALRFKVSSGPDTRSTFGVVQDQSRSNLKGIGMAVTSIPSVVGALGKAMVEPRLLPELITGAVKGITEPVKTIVRGGVEAVAGSLPDRYQQTARNVATVIGEHIAPGSTTGESIDPGSPAWPKTAEATGMNLGGEMLGLPSVRAFGKALPGVRNVVSALERRAGRLTTEPIPRYNQLASDAFGVVNREQRGRIHEAFETAAPEFIKSEQALGGTVANVDTAIKLGKDATQRIYKQELQPFVDKVPESEIGTIGEYLKSQIPSHFTSRARAKLVRDIDARFGNGQKLTGPQLEALRQELTAADRINSAANNFESSAIRKLPNGWFANAAKDAVRQFLIDEVKTRFQTDIGDALKRYGSTTELLQDLERAPISKGMLDRLAGSGYISATTPNIRGKIAEATIGLAKANDRLLRKAFDEYRRVKPVQPFQPPYIPGDVVGAQQDLIPHDISTGPLFEPPPGTSPAIGEAVFGAQQRMNREARNAPPPTVAGDQLALTHQPKSPIEGQTFIDREPFWKGETGVTKEPVIQNGKPVLAKLNDDGIPVDANGKALTTPAGDPYTTTIYSGEGPLKGKPVLALERDFESQGQMFDVNQSAQPPETRLDVLRHPTFVYDHGNAPVQQPLQLNAPAPTQLQPRQPMSGLIPERTTTPTQPNRVITGQSQYMDPRRQLLPAGTTSTQVFSMPPSTDASGIRVTSQPWSNLKLPNVPMVEGYTLRSVIHDSKGGVKGYIYIDSAGKEIRTGKVLTKPISKPVINSGISRSSTPSKSRNK